MKQIENFKIFKTDIHSRAKDLTGCIFGDYQVLYRTECPEGKNPDHAWWLCQCNLCKKYFIKQGSYLTKKTAKNECDCRYDLVGQKIGRWTVQYLLEERTKKRGKIYHCKCECGNEKDVPAETLRRGESQSCGCLNRELAAERCRATRIDLTGQRFGKLVALFPIYSENGGHTLWHCKCDCGNECDIDMGNLRQGFSQSCGCTHSKNEENIIKLLTKNNISFEYQKRFDDLKIKEFDFYINNKYIIEFDGQQHFFFTGYGWDTKDYYERTHKSDLIKNKYCFDNKIPLIRIPYDTDYTIDDLKLETTRFLLTPENEEKYYKTRS
jgi:hypothetical protein